MRLTRSERTKLAWVGLILGLAGRVPTTALAQVPAVVTVEGTDRDLGELPVLVEVAPDLVAPGRYLLSQDGTRPKRPALVYRDESRTFLSFILDQIPAHRSITFRIEPDLKPVDASQGIHVLARGQRLEVMGDGQPWTTYVPDDGPKPYFDPLVGPTNARLTRSWPMRDVPGEPHDHPHHRSLWFAHMDVNKANTWDENPGHGEIREVARPTVLGSGPVGVIRTRNDWLDRTGQPVCTDERVVHFFATQSSRVFDYAVTLKATVGAVKIGDNKDGVFGIRLAAPMAVTAQQGGRITNSRGLIDKAAWGQPAEWVDYTGPVQGETMGVAILNEPTSFRFPTTWHVRDYGLFAANPFGWHDFGQKVAGDYTIAPGESIRLAYRVILHQGTTQAAAIATQFEGYAHPPRVTVR